MWGFTPKASWMTTIAPRSSPGGLASYNRMGPSAVSTVTSLPEILASLISGNLDGHPLRAGLRHLPDVRTGLLGRSSTCTNRQRGRHVRQPRDHATTRRGSPRAAPPPSGGRSGRGPGPAPAPAPPLAAGAARDLVRPAAHARCFEARNRVTVSTRPNPAA